MYRAKNKDFSRATAETTVFVTSVFHNDPTDGAANTEAKSSMLEAMSQTNVNFSVTAQLASVPKHTRRWLYSV